MHALIVCRDLGVGTPEGQQVHGFLMYRKDLQEKLGFTFDLVQAMTLDEIEKTIATYPAKFVVLMISWAEPIENTTALMLRIRERYPDRHIVLLDYAAQTSSELFHLLPLVDRFVKRQVLRDFSIYQLPLEKLFVVTDFLVKRMNFDVSGWDSRNTMPDPAYIGKLVDAWNLGVTPSYRGLLAKTRHFQALWKLRPYAINRRLGFIKSNQSEEWYHKYRRLSLEALNPLARSYRCTEVGRVSSKRYTLEMLLSKLVFSPFGWGEVCFRDYQAVATGALLVKPSMSHLKTNPNIYIENETYVPVAWDFSDLAEKCEYYLKSPRESVRIIRNAQDALYDYFEHDGFVKDVQRCFEIPWPISSTPSHNLDLT